ncbi:MAG: gliding motility protein GldM [Bacteroidales bacterium]|nr:gliding motility protein GldM [Bacteroidales bacterium]
MSGGANCPETPRQKMIGMMYLFLTAMLALNVSKEILNAFVVVNNGLTTTNANYESKNAATMNAIAFAYEQDKQKVKPTYDAAGLVQKRAQEMFDYIANLKKEVINVTENRDNIDDAYGDTVSLMNVGAKDNYDAPTRYFMGMSTTDGTESADGIGGKAPEFRAELEKYVEDLKSAMKSAGVKGIDNLGDLGVDTKDPEEKSSEHPEENNWASSKFFHLPLAATVSILSQIQNSVRNAEATTLNKLLGNIGATDMKFDNLEARVVPKSTYVIQGGAYEADLFVAAWSSTTNPKVIVGPADQLDTSDSLNIKFKPGADTTIVPVIDGVGKYKVPASALGERKYASIIEVKNTSTGDVVSYPLKVGNEYFTSYMVAKPAAVISPTKMNVFYIGVANPVSISVPGFAAESIQPSMSGGTIKPKNKSKGEYEVWVNSRGTASISVSATDDQGNRVSFPKQEFRIKKVPDPVAEIAGVSTGSIAASKLKMASGMKAAMENFDFEMTAVITGFTVSANIGGYEQSKKSNSYQFTSEQKSLIDKVKRGSRVTFESISCKVAGSTRKLRDMSLKLQ